MTQYINGIPIEEDPNSPKMINGIPIEETSQIHELPQWAQTAKDAGISFLSEIDKLGRGLRGLVGETDSTIPLQEKKDVEEAKQRSPIASTTGQIVGDIAPYLATGGATAIESLPARFALSGSQGTVLESLKAKGSQEDPQIAALKGLVLGVGGEIAGESVQQLWSGIKNLVKNPKAAQELIQLGEKYNTPITTSNIAPPTSTLGGLTQSLGSELPFSGVAAKETAQDKGRTAAVENYLEKKNTTHLDVTDSLSRVKNQVINRANEDRKEILDKFGSVQMSPNNSTIRTINRAIKKLTHLPSGKLSATRNSGLIEILQRYKQDISNSPDLASLTELRTRLRDDFEPDFGKAEKIKQGIAKQIYGAMSKDQKAIIRRNGTSQDLFKWEESNNTFLEEVNKIKNPATRKLLNANKALEGQISEQKVLSGVMNNDKNVREDLFNSMDAKGHEATRNLILDEFKRKASSSGQLSPNAFVGLINRNQQIINTWFQGNDKAELVGLTKLLNATKDSQGAGSIPKTGMRNTVIHIVGLLGTAATAGKLLLGSGAFRAYESKPVRDLLIKLAKQPKGSTVARNTISQIVKLTGTTTFNQNKNK